MNKQEYDSLKSGDKLKIVSLDYTAVGDANFEIGEVVEFVEYLESNKSMNDLLIKQSDGDRWYMSSKDLEVIEGEIFVVGADQIKKVESDEDSNVAENFIGVGFEKTPIKSDGGSSSYYFTKLPQHMIDKIVETGGIEIKDITRYVYDNDSDCKDITKALKRIQEWKKGGGKQGIDALYDANKIVFFAEELRESIKNDFGDKLNK